MLNQGHTENALSKVQELKDDSSELLKADNSVMLFHLDFVLDCLFELRCLFELKKFDDLKSNLSYIFEEILPIIST